MSTAEHATKPLYAGQRLSRDEFLRRWEALPEIKFAELINGVVYMPSPRTCDAGLNSDNYFGPQRQLRNRRKYPVAAAFFFAANTLSPR